MKLSVILIVHDMVREIPRTLQSLLRSYQQQSAALEYEVLVIENGSKDRLDPKLVIQCGNNFHYHYLENPPPSPAYAMNYGAKHSTGEILCFMIDGAHLLTPGVFRLALGAFRAFDNPVVATRYFYLGPGAQNETILKGYCKQREDELLEKIQWPNDGYRLFEIGTPLQAHTPSISWFNKMIESNCLFMKRSTFEEIGGAEERFDIPGGGFLNIDMYREAVNVPDALPVQLIGEGSFHQLHGGTTTNVDPVERDNKVETYREQYRDIRGEYPSVSEKDVFFFGHLPTRHSKIHMRNRQK